MIHQTKTIFFVDDHPLVTQGLTFQIDRDPELEVCGSAKSYQEALEKIPALKPNVVVVDLTLEDGNGIDLIKEIKEISPGASCIILSMHNETVFAGRCIRAGAKGYIMKDQPFDVIIEGIRNVANGDVYLSDKVKEQMVEQMTSAKLSFSLAVEELTDREFEIFYLTAEGLRPRLISEKLNVSTRTVNAHYQNIRSKLHLDGMDELVKKSLEWFKKI